MEELCGRGEEKKRGGGGMEPLKNDVGYSPCFTKKSDVIFNSFLLLFIHSPVNK